MSTVTSSPANKATGSTPTHLIRVSAFITRKSTFTSKEFHDYWANKHAPLVVPCLARAGFLDYRIVHITPADHAAAAAILPSIGPEYDRYAIFLVANKEVLFAAYTDPHYLSAIKPDEDYFFDREIGKIIIGYEMLHIVNGKVM